MTSNRPRWPGPASRGGRARLDSIAGVRGTWLATRALVVVTLTASGLLASLGAAPVSAAPTAQRTADDSTVTPLSITMTQLTPSTIPTRGRITMSGRIQNVSKEEWTDINLSPFVSYEPITARDQLAEAAASDSDATVGERMTDEGVTVSIGDLAPGGRADFTISLQASNLQISGAPGVYWIGVHALGANATGRDVTADGRARTFIPLIPKDVSRRRTVPLSLVLPLRDRARRASDGSLNGPARWVNLTDADGRLARLADFATSAGSAPLTWLVDPAVLDALQDFGRGNPPLSLGSDRARSGNNDDGDNGDNDNQDSSPSPSPTATPISGTPSKEEQDRARMVLDTFLSTLRTGSLFSLGYSDPDVAALARSGPKLLRRSNELSVRSLKSHALTALPVVAPPDGYMDPDLLHRVPRDTLVVLSDHEDLDQPPLSRLESGQDLVLTDERAVSGGPSPGAPRTPLALRQRILAEAALEVAKGSEPARPVVFGFPAGWNPGPDWPEAQFFSGLRVPWIRLAPIPRGATASYDGDLPYGQAQLAAEVRRFNIDATRRLTRTSNVLGDLLANDNDVTDRLTGAALQSSSYSARPNRKLAAHQVLALDDTARGDMDEVQVTGTDFVTLSGGSGSLTVTLVNGLEQPVTVGIRPRSDSPGVKVEVPEPVSMQAGQRTTLRLKVASGVGVHEVTLQPVTTNGEAAGTPLSFSLRTSQVGRLIWYIIIAGGVLLAVMVVRRIVLRIRLNRWRVEDR